MKFTTLFNSLILDCRSEALWVEWRLLSVTFVCLWLSKPSHSSSHWASTEHSWCMAPSLSSGPYISTSIFQRQRVVLCRRLKNTSAAKPKDWLQTWVRLTTTTNLRLSNRKKTGPCLKCNNSLWYFVYIALWQIVYLNVMW